jgi:hypothetical protein
MLHEHYTAYYPSKPRRGAGSYTGDEDAAGAPPGKVAA